MRKLSFTISLVIGALTFASLGTAQAQTGKATTVIVVRHAEKAAQPANDPPLTAEGEARAIALWQALKDANVTAVITTQLARTRMTAAPTVANRGITPDVVNTANATHIADVAAAVKRHMGQTVLVVGHSNTVPAIVAALGATEPAAICDPEYDNLYVVTIDPSGKAGVVRGHFGVPTPVPGGCGAPK